jgi:chemotaxis protein MotB
MQRRRTRSEESWLLSYADLITNLLLFFVVLLMAASISTTKMQQIAKAISGAEVPQSLESIKDEIDQRIQELAMQELVRTDIADDGLKLSLDSGLVFASGEARIEPQMESIIASMLEVLTPYSDRYSFAVEGHTDAIPVTANSRYASNWDLSALRAIAVRDRLENTGVQRDRIRVEGYADTRPLPEDSLVGLELAERRARHRRVIVRVH